MMFTDKHLKALQEVLDQVVGLNVGNLFCKAARGDKLLPKMPSLVSMLGELDTFEEQFSAEDVILEIEGIRYAFGRSARKFGRAVQPDHSNDRISGQHYKLMLLAALTLLFPGDGRLSGECWEPLAIGLVVPLATYNNDRQMVKEMLTGSYVIKIIKNGKVAREVEIVLNEKAFKVIPEGRGTLAYLTITRDGIAHDPEGYQQRTIGLTNIGSETIEMMFYGEGMEPQPGLTDDLQGLGVYSACDDLIAWAKNRHNYRMDYLEADEALRRGYFYMGNEPILIDDVDPRDRNYDASNPRHDRSFKPRLLSNMADQIGHGIASLWQGGAKRAYFLPFAGGGAPLFFEYLAERFPHAELVDDPYNSEAEGARRYALLKVLGSMGVFKNGKA